MTIVLVALEVYFQMTHFVVVVDVAAAAGLVQEYSRDQLERGW